MVAETATQTVKIQPRRALYPAPSAKVGPEIADEIFREMKKEIEEVV
jgi:hypothetical protein